MALGPAQYAGVALSGATSTMLPDAERATRVSVCDNVYRPTSSFCAVASRRLHFDPWLAGAGGHAAGSQTFEMPDLRSRAGFGGLHRRVNGKRQHP
jgi:hypothetical protein